MFTSYLNSQKFVKDFLTSTYINVNMFFNNQKPVLQSLDLKSSSYHSKGFEATAIVTTMLSQSILECLFQIQGQFSTKVDLMDFSWILLNTKDEHVKCQILCSLFFLEILDHNDTVVILISHASCPVLRILVPI